jgi:RNA polymerase sigma factor (sigma-70 family)
MATGTLKSMNRMVRHLKRAAFLGEQKVLSDGQLLQSFLSGRDEAAFEILVKRHGPMVLGVCKRVIGNLHDAQDAFQAVFLVLAKKAAAIVPRELVGNWLYGVAYRTALHARAKLCRRRARELQVKDMPHPTALPNFDLLDLHQALDQELTKLPEKYRVPIVLCDLEGRSRKDVAGQLQIPEGTLSSRLTTGRQLLAKRLSRHGLALSGGGLAMMLTQQAAAATMPSTLLAVTVKAAGLTAAGKSAAALLSTHVLALSQGVLKTMFLDKTKVIAVLMFGLLLGGVGAGFVGLPGTNGDQTVHAAQPTAKPAQPDEPIDGTLLLNQQIQQELRLSKNQIDKLLAVSQKVDGKNEPNRKEIEQLRKQIEELQRKITKINDNINKIQGNIEGERKQALGKAAPDILSARALQRIREIQRQRRGLRQLLLDPKIQATLKINDEQFKMIENILKKEPTGRAFYDLDEDSWPDFFLGRTIKGNINSTEAATWLRRALVEPQRMATWQYNTALFVDPGQDVHPLRQLFNVLTESQKKTLLRWVGEPYQSPSWQELWNKNK